MWHLVQLVVAAAALTTTAAAAHPTRHPAARRAHAHVAGLLQRAAAPTYTHAGCYQDGGSPRVLTGPGSSSQAQSPAACASTCAAAGYRYFGLEDYVQCFCGNSLARAAAAAGKCNTPCPGNRTASCGGVGYMDVYEITSAPPLPAPSSSSSSAAHASSAPASSTSSASQYQLTGNAAASVVAAATAAPPAATDARALYAHFIVGNVGRSGHWLANLTSQTYTYKQADWANDIALAKTANIDGFALDLGNVDWEFTSVGYAYAAAANASFKVFFSFDFGASSCASAADLQRVAGLVNQYKASAAQATYKGRPLVSTFSGGSCTFGYTSVAAGWAALRAAVGPMHLVPAVFDDTATLAAATWLDGAFNWNSGWPTGAAPLDTSSDAAYMQALGSNRTYMPAISPAFFTYYGPSSYNKDWIYRSDDWLLAERMEQVIGMRSKVPFAEIISWNDFGESHYIGPLAPLQDQPSSGGWTNGMPHTAWLPLVAYYATAFKTGAYPALTTDRLFLWTRPHPKNAVPRAPTNAKPTNWQDTDDKLYAMFFLTAPANIKIANGANWAQYSLGKGVYKMSMASAPGAISGVIVRNGQVVKHFDSTGIFSSTSTPVDYNFNYFVGSA